MEALRILSVSGTRSSLLSFCVSFYLLKPCWVQADDYSSSERNTLETMEPKAKVNPPRKEALPTKPNGSATPSVMCFTTFIRVSLHSTKVFHLLSSSCLLIADVTKTARSREARFCQETTSRELPRGTERYLIFIYPSESFSSYNQHHIYDGHLLTFFSFCYDS